VRHKASKKQIERRNRKLHRSSQEHQEKTRGWRTAEDGTLEFWFTSCNSDFHPGYWPTCNYCNIGEWIKTDRKFDA
jgi:hypothetical protein